MRETKKVKDFINILRMLLKIMLNVLLMLLEDHISSENISEMYKKTSAKLYNITYFRLNAKNSFAALSL